MVDRALSIWKEATVVILEPLSDIHVQKNSRYSALVKELSQCVMPGLAFLDVILTLEASVKMSFSLIFTYSRMVKLCLCSVSIHSSPMVAILL
jgi:hypothetical protein